MRAAAHAFERDVVIPHCASCSRPCCGLTDVVLELSFQQVDALYQIGKPQKDFDRALPSMIKKQGDRYYAHGAACPAFNTADHRCRVYETKTKPQECSDFPVYDDDDVITADRRCEAVDANLADLRRRLRAAVSDPALLVDEEPDGEFPELFVTFAIMKKKQAPTTKKPLPKKQS